MKKKMKRLYRSKYFTIYEDYFLVEGISDEVFKELYKENIKYREEKDNDDWTFFSNLEELVKAKGGTIDFFLWDRDSELIDL